MSIDNHGVNFLTTGAVTHTGNFTSHSLQPSLNTEGTMITQRKRSKILGGLCEELGVALW